MDILVLKRHGLKIIHVSPLVLLASVVSGSLVGYFWFFSIPVVVAGTVLGGVLFYCCTCYWLSGKSIYWFLGVVGASVMPAIILKSFYGASLLISVEFIVSSALVLINKKRLVSALPPIT